MIGSAHGTAHGSDSELYNLEGDMRIFSGTYVPVAAAKQQGTFCLV
jgi:hypothetical protein